MPRRTAVKVASAILVALGLAAIAAGFLADRFWPQPDHVAARAAVSDGNNAVVVDSGVLNLVSDDVTIRASVPDGQPVTLVLGRDVDVAGWLGDSPAAHVGGLSDWENLTLAEAAQAGGPGAPDPAGSDLWAAEVSGQGSVEMNWQQAPGRWSALAVAPGSTAAPQLELEWPRVATQPMRWPLIGSGIALTALGSALALFGPRKKIDISQPLPEVVTGPVAEDWTEIIVPKTSVPLPAGTPVGVGVGAGAGVREPWPPPIEAAVLPPVSEPVAVVEPDDRYRSRSVPRHSVFEEIPAETVEAVVMPGEAVEAVGVEPVAREQVEAERVREAGPVAVIGQPVAVAEPAGEPVADRVPVEFTEPIVPAQVVAGEGEALPQADEQGIEAVSVVHEDTSAPEGTESGQAQRVFAEPIEVRAPAPTSRREVKAIRRLVELTSTAPVLGPIVVADWPSDWDVQGGGTR